MKGRPLPACACCGMVLEHPEEYHPFAACLMYKQCKDESTVRANLFAVIGFGQRSRIGTTCPEGWQLVPIEPTPGMLNEITWLDGSTVQAIRVRYAALLKAAPKP